MQTACLKQLKPYYGCFSVFVYVFCFCFKCATAEIKHCFISVLFQLCGHRKVCAYFRVVRKGNDGIPNGSAMLIIIVYTPSCVYGLLTKFFFPLQN